MNLRTSEYSDSTGSTGSEAIQDGHQYWVAVAAFDEYDNASLPLPFAGPTTAFNDSYINSRLALFIESGPAEATTTVLESTSPLSIRVDAYYLDDAQQPVAIENADLELTMSYGASETFVLNGQTDSSGQWLALDVSDLHDATIPQSLLDYSATSEGQVNIEVEMQSIGS